jgi:predicted TIM-barrel fold metal-dependent hydrolase
LSRAPWEVGARTDGSPGTYEWWYFDAHLDDGGKLVVTFMNKDIAEPRKPLSPLAMSRDKIDVHAHFIPEMYRDALVAAGQDQPDGIPALPDWDEALAVAAMDEIGVRRAILSISSPGVHFGDAAAAVTLARSVNEAGAQITAARPGRFGFFATLPLPEVDAAAAETRYALDSLGAAGICLLTNHRGMYPGDERLDPVFAEVASRGSVVFVHPTSPPQPAAGPRIAPPVLEFMFETTRSVTDLVLSGVLERYPSLRVIVPHAGAALPVLAGRIDMLAPVLASTTDGTDVADERAALLASPGDRAGGASLRAALKALHFDLAGAPVEEQLAALLAVADPSRLHYGSDFPFTPTPACQYLARQLQTSRNLDGAAIDAIFHDNAERLFPHVRTRLAASPVRSRP